MTGHLRERLEMRGFELESTGLGQDDSQAGIAGLNSPPRKQRERRLIKPAHDVASVVELEIIPRLVSAIRSVRTPASIDAKAATTEVDDFARLVLGGSVAEACSRVETMRSQGLSLEQIYLDLIEPAARRMGDYWKDDVCDFVAVTLGTLRLQQILHEFGLAFRGEVKPREHGHRVLLVPAPGEEASFGHLIFGAFGLVLAAEFLRRDGWDAYLGCSASGAETVGIVRREWFDVVEISLTLESHLDDLAAGIRQIRRASRNRTIGVIVSGPAFRDHPENITSVGADMSATDGRDAAIQADNLMELQRRKRP